MFLTLSESYTNPSHNASSVSRFAVSLPILTRKLSISLLLPSHRQSVSEDHLKFRLKNGRFDRGVRSSLVRHSNPKPG